MHTLTDGLKGSVSLALSDYHDLLAKATSKEEARERYLTRLKTLESAAREVESFLSFLYKNTELNMDSYVEAFNSKSEVARLIIDKPNKRIKVNLTGENSDDSS